MHGDINEHKILFEKPDHLEDTDVNRRIILEWILDK